MIEVVEFVWREVQANRTGREVVFWSVGEQENLYHETMEEAANNFIETWRLPFTGEWPEDQPDVIELVGYAREEPSICPGISLDHLLEHLDEEYGDPQGGIDDPTPAMIAAEKAFHEVVLAEYETWACKPVTRRLVNVRAWLKTKR